MSREDLRDDAVAGKLACHGLESERWQPHLCRADNSSGLKIAVDFGVRDDFPLLTAPRIMKRTRFALAAAVAFIVLPAMAGAQPVTFVGFDAGAIGVGAASSAAQSAFLAATGGAVVEDFEVGNTLVSGPSVSRKNSPFCPIALCGDNTTVGGDWFIEVYGQSATVTFGTPVDYFGGFFGGLQIANSLSFTDIDGAQVVNIPSGAAGGFAFVGFHSFGSSISSVTINANNDIISVDDLIFGNSVATVVPEPGTYALVFAGLAMIGAVRARRRSSL